MSVYLTLLKPGDTVLGMNLRTAATSRTATAEFFGKLYTIVPHGVRER
jgi:glycine hydroxymethyltransferase